MLHSGWYLLLIDTVAMAILETVGVLVNYEAVSFSSANSAQSSKQSELSCAGILPALVAGFKMLLHVASYEAILVFLLEQPYTEQGRRKTGAQSCC